MLMRAMSEKYFTNIEILVISLSYELMATPAELEEEAFKLETFTLPQGQNIHCYSKRINKITYVFLKCNNGVFIKPYIYKSTPNMIFDHPLIFFPYCAVHYLKNQQIIPSVIISNDYVTIAIAPLMKKEPFFPQHKTKFVHICHLLESLNLQAADKMEFSDDTQFDSKRFLELTDYEQISLQTTFTGFFIKFLDYFVTVSPTYLSFQIKPLNFCKDFPCTGIINGIIK